MTSDDANLPRGAGQRSHAPRPAIAPYVPSSATLERLVDRSIDGDQRALTELLRSLRPLVVRYCRSRLGEYERVNASADDVAQEVCLAVLRALPTYQDQGRPFLAFVYGIAQHKVVDGHRSAIRDRSIPFATLPDSSRLADFTDEPWPSTQLQAELGVDIDEDESTVGALLSDLPALEREVIRLSVVAGLGPGRTAEALGIAPETAVDAQRRALGELRTRLEEMQDEDELRDFHERDWEGAPITGYVGLDALLHSADENLQRLLPEAERGPSIYQPPGVEPTPRSGATAAEAAPTRDQSQPTTPDRLRGSPGFLARRLYQAYSAAWLRHVDTTLTGPQFAVLTAVREYPGVDQGSLAAYVALDRSTMADVCKRLEDRALIRRDTAPSDGRRKLLTLTDQGAALFEDVTAKVARLHAELMDVPDGTADDEGAFAALLADLDRLAERWEKVAEGSTIRVTLPSLPRGS